MKSIKVRGNEPASGSAGAGEAPGSARAGKPKQASLRRALSTAYYALFHLLVDEATKMFVADSKFAGSSAEP